MALIELDGAHEEGGGAILRVALALSTATGKPFRIKNIRANRPTPGLKQQHLVGIKALQELSGAKVTDCHPGSIELTFIPGEKLKTKLEIDAVTAAPVTLILQSILPAIVHHGRRTKLVMTGGTDVKWAPPIDYFSTVFARALREHVMIETKILKRGYFPKGQGLVEVTITPKSTHPLRVTRRGELHRIAVQSTASAALQKPRVAERQADAAEVAIKNSVLVRQHDVVVTKDVEYDDAASIGSGILVRADYEHTALAADGLGERGVKAESVGEGAVQRLLDELSADGAVDRHLADQLVPYLALFGGEITVTEITKHARANMHVCELFLDVTFRTEGNNIFVEKPIL